MSARAKATLLFAHGSGFCKEIWDPIIRRLQVSPLLQRVATDYVKFNFPYHGEKRDNDSVPVQWDRSNPDVLRVIHPAQDMVNSMSLEVVRQVKKLQPMHQAEGKPKSPLIGIGHSMGAASLWNAEVTHPGTFDGLILFEPVYGLNQPHNMPICDYLVSVTLPRRTSWPSFEAAYAYFHELSNFSRWDRESLDGYIRGALIQENDGTVSLACHPHIEAAFYCHKTFLLSEDQLVRPQCEQITFHYGTRTRVFVKELFDSITTNLPHLYAMGEPIPNASHLMVMEDPKLAASRILDDLARLPPFREEPTNDASS